MVKIEYACTLLILHNSASKGISNSEFVYSFRIEYNKAVRVRVTLCNYLSEYDVFCHLMLLEATARTRLYFRVD
jgi:hypothetical protein